MLRWGQLVRGETADGVWTLPFQSFDPETIEVSPAGSTLPEAVYEKETKRTGSMLLSDGQSYRWQATRWSREAQWSKLDGTVLVRTQGAAVIIEETTARPSHLSVLVLAAEYLNSIRLANRIMHVGGALGHFVGLGGH